MEAAFVGSGVGAVRVERLGAARVSRRSAARAATKVSMAFSSIQNVLTDAPTDATVSTSVADVVYAIYYQVLGNAHLMESERAELATAESDFCMDLNVKEFIRAIAKSNAYSSRFFHNSSQYRFFEMNLKHLLGRAPRSQQEIASYFAIYAESGYDACIDACLDSGEYDAEFGNNLVPYLRFKGLYPTNEEFNRICALRGPRAMSDKCAGGKAKVGGAVASGTSPAWLTIAKGLPAGTEQGTGYVVGSHWASATSRNTNAAVRVGTKIPGGVVFY